MSKRARTRPDRNETSQTGGLDEELRVLLDEADEGDRAQPADVSREVLARVRAGKRARDASWRGQLQALPTSRRLAVTLSASLAAVLGVAFFAPRADLYAYPDARMALVLGVLGGLGVALARGALRPWQKPAVTIRAAVGWTALAAATALLFAALPSAHVLLPYTVPPPGQALWDHASRCLAFGLACGAPLILLVWLIGRDTPHATLVATGLAGVVGNLALQLHCPITEPTHLVAGHATVGVVALVLWLLPRSRLRRPS